MIHADEHSGWQGRSGDSNVIQGWKDVYREGQWKTGVLRIWQEIKKVCTLEYKGTYRGFLNLQKMLKAFVFAAYFQRNLYFWTLLVAMIDTVETKFTISFKDDRFVLYNVNSRIDCNVLWSMFTIYLHTSNNILDMESEV